MTAQEIYRQMLITFSEKTGQPLDPGCDLAVRMYAAAAQLETLYQYADWSRRQAFPQTAGQQYLDYHGQMRSLSRRPAQRAKGSVRILLGEGQPVDLAFSAGMRLLAANDAEYTLDEDYVLPAGATHFTAGVTAVETGAQGNLPASTRLMFSGGPACVSAVIATDSFTGGADQETDDAFRERILQSFRPGSNGANAAYYKSVALSVPGIVACSVIGGARGALTLDIVPADENGLPSQLQCSEILQLVQDRMEVGIDIAVVAPTRVLLDAEVQLRCADGVSFEQAKEAVEAVFLSYFTGRLLGTPVYASALSHRIFATGLVKDCVVDLDGRGDGIEANELPILEALRITEVAS